MKRHFSRIVKVGFEEVLTPQNKLVDSINTAYNKDSLGIMVVQNVPGVRELREKLLKDAFKLVNLPKEELEKLERPEIHYSQGYSYGKEYFEGKPDNLKASYYSALAPLSRTVPNTNVWPKQALPSLENNFLETGNKIREVGLKLISVIDGFLEDKLGTYPSQDHVRQIKRSDSNTGRLLYYFPNENRNNTTWTGWHNDHGSFTGLLNGIYMNREGHQVTPNLTKSGLYVQNRKGEKVRVTYGPDDLAFQIGETYQLNSGGLLQATPHAVKVYEDMPIGVGRATFAMFLEPSLDEPINIPRGKSIEDVKTAPVYKVPKIEERYQTGMNFGEFSTATFKHFSE